VRGSTGSISAGSAAAPQDRPAQRRSRRKRTPEEARESLHPDRLSIARCMAYTLNTKARAAHAPWRRQGLLELVLSILPVAVWITDATGKVVYGNPAASRLWGGEANVGFEQLGRRRGRWISTGKRIGADQWASARAIRKGETSIDEEIEIECSDGTQRVILNSATPIRNSRGRITGAVVVNHDITDRKRYEERLRELAEHDSLTGAYTRRYLYDFLDGEIRRSQRYGTPLSLIMFDIDHFKKINDAHGHQAGDRVLARIAQLVRGELRTVDRLARYGGEEFVIVTPGITRGQAAVLAERLRRRIATAQYDSIGRVTCSFGVCQSGGGSTDSFIRRVDNLLYRAKRAGRNRVATGR
jgi:diguanylate cyclase (GGDEF)-like protein/PAS domain S-box-containing protein